MKNKGKNNKDSLIFTRETLGMTLLLFCAIVLLSLFTGRTVFAGFGGAICTFMYGTFGYGSYFVVALLAYLGEWLAFEKTIKIKWQPALWCSLTVVCLFLLFQTVTTRGYEFNSSYIAQCYTAAKEGWSGYTFGGVISALIVYPVVYVTKLIGAYIIFSILTVFFAYVSVMSVRKHYFKKAVAPDNTVRLHESNKDSEPSVHTVNPVFVGGQPAQESAVTDNSVYEHVPQEANVNVYGGQADVYETVPPVQQVLAREPVPAQGQTQEIDYKTLGPKLLLDDDFAAENYRRNGIFDENSYFNHPIHSDEDYLKGFSNGKKGSGTNIQKTYSSAYQESVEQQKTGMPGSVYYGDEPTDKLEDYTQASTGAYSSQPQTESVSDVKDPYEVFPYETNTQSEQPAEVADGGDALFGGYKEQPAEDHSEGQPYVPEDNGTSRRGEDFSARSASGTNEFSVRGDSLQDGSRRQAGFGERSRDGSVEPEAAEGRPADDNSFNELYNLFGSGNSRLSETRQDENERIAPRGADRAMPSSEENISPSERGSSNLFGGEDRTESPRQRSNANLFDEDTQPESRSERGNSNLFGGEDRTEGPRQHSNANLFDDVPEETGSAPQPETNEELPPVRTSADEEVPVARTPLVSPMHRTEIKEEKKEEPAPPPKPHVWKKYVRPSYDLLDDYPGYGSANAVEVEENKQIIVETLANFNIGSEISDVVIGPSLTRYDVIILDKTNIKRSLNYKEAIAMALKKDNLNAYLNYAKGALSIEVPNTKRSIVGLKSMLMSSSYMNCKPNSLTFALGKNLEGEPICPDITKMPHLLVAGTTGSGKSICLSTLLISLLYKYGPEELRLILVDPKQVEFISYDKLPHLMINEIIYDVDKAIKALNWAIKEMERRYSLFKEMTESGTNAKGGKKVATKDLNEYNSHLEDGLEKLPKIVIILDEFGDLMLQAKKDIESRIIKLVQKARACGIHLILATQRPSVDCITGLIKSNLPTKIGFKVSSINDSQVIFGSGGAEKLLGAGDMYYRSSERPDLIRIQGCFVGSQEVQKVTDFIKENNETYFDQSVSDFINKVEEPEVTASIGDGNGSEIEETKIDDVFLRALKYCVDSNKASVSMLQRRFPIGYMKACKIIDWMENMNYITKGEGPNSRKVLLSRDEFINTYGDIDD
ncbi:MAG: hypothetical protein LUD19_05710 [Clostridia bacterium]|nr:hypothetical protein [Clostridia bacterium]